LIWSEEEALATEGTIGNNGGPFTPGRVTVAIVLSFLSSLFIWIVTPYSNFILNTGYVSDDYLPPSVLVLLLLGVLIINPVLLRIRRSWALNFKQIALIVGMGLVAVSIASSGLLGKLPYSLARQVRDAGEWQEIAGYYEHADLPPSLFPGEVGYHVDTEIARQFLVQIRPGEPIPWGTWLGPAASWLSFFVFVWMMCISLSGIVLPQWRQKERLPFPLTRILQSFMETPEDGRLLPPTFREKWFWIAALTVLFLHTLVGLNTYFPRALPAYQMDWNFWTMLTDKPWEYLPMYTKQGRFYFIVIGVSYFISARVSFSIWFFMVAYALYTMICTAYTPPFFVGVPIEHRSGALLTVTLMILWLGRARWLSVFRCAVRPRGSAHSAADRRDRNFAYMFCLGILGMLGWYVWAGVQVHWAVVLVAFIFVYQLVISRVVAETGIPVVGLYDEHFLHYFSLIPIRFLNGASAWFLGATSSILHGSNRTAVAAMAMQSLSLDETAQPRHQWRSARYFLLLLAMGFFICGAAHIYFKYNHSETLEIHPKTPNYMGTLRLYAAIDRVEEQMDGEWDETAYSRPAHMIFGAAMAGALQYASLTMPKWPLHYVGLLLSYTHFAETVWASVMIGWLLRVVPILFGGVRLYRRLRPLFMGLIIGEVLAAIVWFSVSGVLAFYGYDYRIVPILPFGSTYNSSTRFQ